MHRAQVDALCQDAGLAPESFDVLLKGVEIGRIEAIVRGLPEGAEPSTLRASDSCPVSFRQPPLCTRRFVLVACSPVEARS